MVVFPLERSANITGLFFCFSKGHTQLNASTVIISTRAGKNCLTLGACAERYGKSVYGRHLRKVAEGAYLLRKANY